MFQNLNWSYIRWLSYDEVRINRAMRHNQNGYSIRCVKNEDAGIQEGTGNNQIMLYPNPAGTTVYLKNVTSGTKAEIYTVAGKLAHSKIYTDKIDVSGLEIGVYMVNISANDYHRVLRLVKE